MEDTPKFEAIEKNHPMKEEVEPKVHKEKPLISLNALSNILSPQTLKLLGYIKCHKVVVLVESGRIHNFIH